MKQIKHQLIQQQVLLVPRDLIFRELINQQHLKPKMQRKQLHLHLLGYLRDWVSLRRLLPQHKHLKQTSLMQQTLPSLHPSFQVYLLVLVSELQPQSLPRKRILTNLLTFLARSISWLHPLRMVTNLRAALTRFKIRTHQEETLVQTQCRWSHLEHKKACSHLLRRRPNSQMPLVCSEAWVHDKVLKSRKQLSQSQLIHPLPLILCLE